MSLMKNRTSIWQRLAATLVLSVSVSGCEYYVADKAFEGATDLVLNTISGEPLPPELRGIWEQTGYGDIFEVEEFSGTLYEYTRNGCVKEGDYLNDGLQELFKNPVLSEDGRSLTITPDGDTVFGIQARKLDSLPEACLSENRIRETTPTVMFEHMWHTFNDYYAFFAERGVDWNDQYAQISPMVNDDLSDEELVEVFALLLEPLNDGHITLVTDDDEFGFTEVEARNQLVLDTFPNQTEFSDIQDYADSLVDQYKTIRDSYLDAESIKSNGGESGDVVTWATINNNVGYLRISEMIDLTQDENEDIAPHVVAINYILKEVFADLQNTSAMIIDVRFNGGGSDAVSMAIANHFTDQTTLALSKRARGYYGETEIQNAYISPANDMPYLSPVAIISSPETASAAETFLVAMSALPQVSIVGESSNGILSDTLFKALPNGWEFSFSNEIYTDILGNSYEVSGITPDVPAQTFSLDAFAQNKDFAIEASLNTLGF